MMLIPIGAEGAEGRRQPAATWALMGLCVVVFLATTSKIDTQAQAQFEALANLEQVVLASPYVTVPPEVLAQTTPKFQRMVSRFQAIVREYDADPSQFEDVDTGSNSPKTVEAIAVQALSTKGRGMGDPSHPAVAKRMVVDALKRAKGRRDVAQGQLNDVANRFLEQQRTSVIGQYGFVSNKKTLKGLLGHMFLHGGLFHILFNLLFFYVAAVALEQYYSAAGVVALYLLAGVAGAMAQAVTHPASAVPMIGASGAVAGFLGAFVVRLAGKKIHFWYIYMVMSIRTGKFSAPAWLMIPLWFVGELFMALFVDLGGVAYWAHVGGFAAGVGFALVLKFSRFEKHVLGYDPDLESKLAATVWLPDAPAPPRPGAAPAKSRTPALEALTPVPELPSAIIPLLKPLVPPSPRRALAAALEANDTAAALAAYRQLDAAGLSITLPPVLELHLAHILDDVTDYVGAAKACRRAFGADKKGPYAPRAMYLCGRILAERLGRKADARQLLSQLVHWYPTDPFALRARELIEQI